MSDAREALMALIRGEYAKHPVDRYPTEGALADAILAAGWTSPLVESAEDRCASCGRARREHRSGYAAHRCEFKRTPPGERVKPTLEQVVDALAAQRPGSAEWTSSRIMQTARAVLALFPGRTETEVKAEALREAADTLRAEGMTADAWYADWLDDRADTIEKEAPDVR